MSKEAVLAELRQLFPHGHPDYIPKLVDMMELHSKKNYEYASGGDPLGNFKRVASILSQYPKLNLSKPETVAIVYMLKQLDAVLWQLNSGYEGNIEGKESRLSDITVYSAIAALLLK